MKWHLFPAARFDVLAPHWAALHSAGPAAPMLAPAFVSALLRQFGTGREQLAVCQDGAGPCAVAVLAPQGRGRWATFQPAQAPLGLWLQRPGLDSESLLAGLAGSLPGFVLQVGLAQCDPLLLPRPQDGGRTRSLDYIDTAWIDVAGSFDAYWSARGKNLRSNLKKQRKRLHDEGIATRLEVLAHPEHMAEALACYGRLESAGWKARSGTAVDAANTQGRFYASMLEDFAAAGGARVYRYWFGARPVAMDLCILERDAIVVLKTAYDESVGSALSPALLMREEALRALFDEGRVARVEFYGRVMDWHMRWTDQVRTLYHLNHYRWPALAHLHALLQDRAGTPNAIHNGA